MGMAASRPLSKQVLGGRRWGSTQPGDLRVGRRMRHSKGRRRLAKHETTAEPGGGPRQGRTACVSPATVSRGLIIVQAHPLPGARGVTRSTRGALASVTDPEGVRTTDIWGLAGPGRRRMRAGWSGGPSTEPGAGGGCLLPRTPSLLSLSPRPPSAAPERSQATGWAGRGRAEVRGQG